MTETEGRGTTEETAGQPTTTTNVPNYGTNNAPTSNNNTPHNNNSNNNEASTSKSNANNTTTTSTNRIEPKVWLANERTWLNWCRTGVLIGSFGTVLLNTSSASGARILGFFYSLIAVGTISYGHFLYKKRIKLIENRHPGHFDDLIAPIIIAVSLFTAILVNFILRVRDQERHRAPGLPAPKSPWIAAPASVKFPPLAS